MVDHCSNFDASYEGCLQCPGKAVVTRPDGSVDTLCRAGEKRVLELLATVDNGLPVYPVLFPAPERA